MTLKPVIPRTLAQQDIDEALEYFLAEAGETIALRFVDDLEKAFSHLGRHGATGSPRYAHELNLPGLRSWQLTRFPYLIFYMERADHIDVWRVLHSYRNIPAWLQEGEA